MNIELNTDAEHEILAFYRTPESKKIVSQMRVSPEIVEIEENILKIDEAISKHIHKNLIESMKKLAPEIDEPKVEYWFHEFLESWEKDEDGNDVRDVFTIFKLPITFNQN